MMKIRMKKIKRNIRKAGLKITKWLMASSEGFSYVETVICIAVMLLLTVCVGAASVKMIDRARVAKCLKEMESFRLALEEYYSECGVYPSKEQGLESLWKKPVLYPVPSRWNGPYLDGEVPDDPWGNSYVYKVPGSNSLPYEIISYGADGKSGGEGKEEDIYSWKRR